MANFAVQLNAIPGIQQDYARISQELLSASNAVKRQMKRLSGQSGFGVEEICGAMKVISSNINRLVGKTEELSDFVVFLEDESRQADSQSGKRIGDASQTQGLGVSAAEVAALLNWGTFNTAPVQGSMAAGSLSWIYDFLKKTAGGSGGIPSLISGILAALENDQNGKGVTKTIKNVNGILSTIKSMQNDYDKLSKLSRMLPGQAVKTGIKRLLGLQDVFGGNASQAASFGMRFYNNAHKSGISIESQLDKFVHGSKSGIAAKWIGVGLSGVINGFENYEEHGGFTARAVAETVSETAIDVGKGILTTTVVAAGIGAAFGAAPAVAVAAVSVGVTWAADKICEKVTGKDLTEFISDTVLDKAEAVGKGVVDAGRNLVNGGKKVIGKITGWWNKVTA